MAEQQVKADPKYGMLDKKIVDMLESYEHEYFREDKPVPFCGLLIYPVAVRDFEIFSNCTSCLTLNKNETPAGISMNNLDYLIYKMKDPKSGKEGEPQVWSYKCQKLFEIIFRLTNGMKCKQCGKIIKYDDKIFTSFIERTREFIEKSQNKTLTKDDVLPKLVCHECGGEEFDEMIKIVPDEKNPKHNNLLVDGHLIKEEDFLKLRQIVMYQNYYDYVDDSWVDAEIKKDHDEKVRLEQQKNDVHASIEKKVVCLSITTNYKFSEIYDMSIRKFTLALATVDDLINYKIMRQAVSSGFVSLPKGETIDHWIYKPNKDMYGDYKSMDELQQQVGNI